MLCRGKNSSQTSDTPKTSVCFMFSSAAIFSLFSGADTEETNESHDFSNDSVSVAGGHI